jgi:hypothetical protein
MPMADPAKGGKAIFLKKGRNGLYFALFILMTTQLMEHKRT